MASSLCFSFTLQVFTHQVFNSFYPLMCLFVFFLTICFFFYLTICYECNSFLKDPVGNKFSDFTGYPSGPDFTIAKLAL